MAPVRRRLDQEMVRRGLAPSREVARTLVEGGLVLVRGAVADKPARLAGADEPIVVRGGGPRFVSRGGEKLEAALIEFGVDVAGLEAIDVGSSTGGFTDCLLGRGASLVVAIDVGTHQLHERLRGDTRVTCIEQLHVRDAADRLRRRFPLLVADLSFISLATAADAICALIDTCGQAVLLVKPQFEAGRREVSRGRGVITDPLIHRKALVDVADAFSARGGVMMGCMRSPLLGTEGNTEFLVHIRWGEDRGDVATCSPGVRTGTDPIEGRQPVDAGAWFDANRVA